MVSHDPDVDASFDRYGNPQRVLVMAVRDVILDADPRVTGVDLRMTTPFTYEGNIASSFRRPRTTSP